MIIHGYSRLYIVKRGLYTVIHVIQDIDGYTQGIHGYTCYTYYYRWLYMAIDGYTWLYMVIDGHAWLSTYGYRWLYMVIGSYI